MFSYVRLHRLCYRCPSTFPTNFFQHLPALSVCSSITCLVKVAAALEESGGHAVHKGGEVRGENPLDQVQVVYPQNRFPVQVPAVHRLLFECLVVLPVWKARVLLFYTSYNLDRKISKGF